MAFFHILTIHIRTIMKTLIQKSPTLLMAFAIIFQYNVRCPDPTEKCLSQQNGDTK